MFFWSPPDGVRLLQQGRGAPPRILCFVPFAAVFAKGGCIAVGEPCNMGRGIRFERLQQPVLFLCLEVACRTGPWLLLWAPARARACNFAIKKDCKSAGRGYEILLYSITLLLQD